MAFISAYYAFPGYLAGGGIDWDTDSISATLHTSSYTPSRSHAVWSDVSASEVSHAGYSPGGVPLSGKAVTLSGTDTKLTGTIPSITPTGSSMACRYMILRKGSGAGVAGDKLIGYIDMGSQTVGASKILSVSFSNGIFTLQPGA
jgi:hypothetical protein